MPRRPVTPKSPTKIGPFTVKFMGFPKSKTSGVINKGKISKEKKGALGKVVVSKSGPRLSYRKNVIPKKPSPRSRR